MKGCVVSGGSGYGNCDFSEVNYIVFIRVIFTRGNTRNALRISEFMLVYFLYVNAS